MVCRADQKPHEGYLGYNTCMGIIAHDIHKYNLELIIITHILIMHLNKVNLIHLLIKQPSASTGRAHWRGTAEHSWTTGGQHNPISLTSIYLFDVELF